MRSIALFCLLALSTALVQAADYGLQPHPNLHLQTAGEVWAIAPMPDGGVVIGGRFREVDGVPRRNLARLHADGSLDTSWAVESEVEVYALAADATGNVYAPIHLKDSADFVRLTRVDATGAIDPSFQFALDGYILALHLAGNGNLYVGGEFERLGDSRRANLARIDLVTGSVDRDWGMDVFGVAAIQSDADYVYISAAFAGADEYVCQLARLGHDGIADTQWRPYVDVCPSTLVLAGRRLYAAGRFRYAGSTPVAHLARWNLDPSPTFDTQWTPALGGTSVDAIAVDDAGDLIASGDFTHVNGLVHQHYVKLAATDAAANAVWQPDAVGSAGVLSVMGDGRVIAGGKIATQRGPLKAGVLRFAADTGEVDTAYRGKVLTEGEGSVVTMLHDGTSLVGGDFLAVDGVARRHLIHLHADGALDTGWAVDVDGTVSAIVEGAAPYPIYLGGRFSQVSGVTRDALARLHADASVDAAWGAGVTTQGLPGSVNALLVDGVGHIVAGGDFDHASGLPRARLARFAEDSGALDANWRVSANASVRALTTSGDGNVFAGGQFFVVNGRFIPYLASIDVDGNLDYQWNPRQGGTVNHLVYDAAGQALYAAGDLTYGDGGPAHLVRLPLVDFGYPDIAWHTSTPLGTSALTLDAEGYLYFATSTLPGLTDAVSGVMRTNIRAIADGALDPAWYAPLRGSVHALAVRPDGNVLLAGIFTQVLGQERHSLAAVGGAGETLFANGFEVP